MKWARLLQSRRAAKKAAWEETILWSSNWSTPVLFDTWYGTGMPRSRRRPAAVQYASTTLAITAGSRLPIITLRSNDIANASQVRWLSASAATARLKTSWEVWKACDSRRKIPANWRTSGAWGANARAVSAASRAIGKSPNAAWT